MFKPESHLCFHPPAIKFEEINLNCNIQTLTKDFKLQEEKIIAEEELLNTQRILAKEQETIRHAAELRLREEKEREKQSANDSSHVVEMSSLMCL